MSKIIHCITTISLGGAEKQLLTLVEQQVANGKEVAVIYLKGCAELKYDFEQAGAKVLDFLANKKFYKQIYLLRKFLKNKSIILHAHLPRSELICAIIKQRNYLVLSKHNSEQFFPNSNANLSKYMAQYVFFRSNFCICISEAVKKYLLEIKEVRDSSKLAVVYYGYSRQPKNFAAKNLSIKIKMRYKNKFVIGTIGRIVPQKNYKILLEAFSKFCEINPDARLIVIGNGTHQKFTVELAKRLNVFSRITWIPKTSSVYEYLYAMDVFVLASNYEGFGLVLLEAMQTNTPIIAANNSSIPEVVGVNYQGLFETGNSEELVSKLLKTMEKPYRERLTQNYSVRLASFNPKTMYNRIETCYQKAKQL